MKRRLYPFLVLGLLSAGAGALPPFSEGVRPIELRQQYPQFETRLGRALLQVQQRHPGVAAGVLRHWLEDLGDEPRLALQQVHADILAHYPDFDRKLAERLGQRREEAGALAARFPGLRSWVLERLSQEQRPLSVRTFLQREHPGLMLKVALTASLWADEHAPDLPRRFRQRSAGEKPLAFLAREYPDLGAQLLRYLAEQHGHELRQAAIGLLQSREQWARQHPERATAWFEALQKDYPELLGALGEQRAARLDQRQNWIQENFPELPSIARASLQKHHPDLLQRARASVEKHYPGLRQELQQALESELPGIRQKLWPQG